MLLKQHETFGVERRKRGANFCMADDHVHPYYELYYLLSGTRKYFINHSFYTLNPNDIMLISKGDIHRTTHISKMSHERIVLYFDDSWLADLCEEYGKERVLNCFKKPKITVPEEYRDYIVFLLERIRKEHMANGCFSRRLIHHYFEELFLYLLIYQESHTDELEIEGESNIQKAAKYICKNYQKELTLEQVASVANVSPTYFSKKFKSSTGFGFKEYLNHIRLKEATKQLLETTDTITEIALRCGFNDSNYFGDLFKKINGVSPRQFRSSDFYL